MSLRSVDEVLADLLADVRPVSDCEQVSLAESCGRVLAETQYATFDMPAADNSAMDGYALCWSDWQATPDAVFPISQRIPAGSVGAALKPNTIARIFTGAELPENADTIVMQEDCQVSDAGVLINAELKQAQHVRPKGQDVRVGQELLSAGTCLSPANIGLLAAQGIAEVPVVRQISVAVLSTGDELLNPGETMQAGKLFNSNGPMLSALLKKMGCRVLNFANVADTAEATRAALLAAAEQADCIISTGGVSVGEEDHVKSQVEALGSLLLWKLAIKPGKPFAYGKVGDTPFLGLPGNPSSSFVTFCLLARPYLLRLQGVSQVQPVIVNLHAAFEWKKPGSRQQYLMARVQMTETSDTEVIVYNNHSSGLLGSISWANALAIVPPGTTVAPGDSVKVLLLSELG